MALGKVVYVLLQKQTHARSGFLDIFVTFENIKSLGHMKILLPDPPQVTPPQPFPDSKPSWLGTMSSSR